MYFRIVWWMLAVTSAVVLALQLSAAVSYASARGYESIAFIALFGLWSLPIVGSCLAMSGWRWRQLPVPMRWFGVLVPGAVVVLSVGAGLLAA